jgi:hypothetical protein
MGEAVGEAQLRQAVDLLDVDYRKSGLVSGTVSRQEIQKKVIGLEVYKRLKIQWQFVTAAEISEYDSCLIRA